MESLILTKVIESLFDFVIILCVPNYSSYQYYKGKYMHVTVHHFISHPGEFVTRMIRSACGSDIMTNPS